MRVHWVLILNQTLYNLKMLYYRGLLRPVYGTYIFIFEDSPVGVVNFVCDFISNLTVDIAVAIILYMTLTGYNIA